MFDFGNFSKDSKFYDNQNEMVVGKMKDECKGILINKFFGLKSKMHCMLSDDDEESNTAKEKNIAIEFKEYEDALLNKKVIRHKMKRIQIAKHITGIFEVSKTSLSFFDDKRFVLDDGIHTLDYFDKDLKRNRFSQIIINKKRFSNMIINKKRFSQIISAHR